MPNGLAEITTMKTEELAKELNAGIECPVCQTILYEEEPQGIFVGQPDIHTFVCEDCGISIIISNFLEDED